MMGTRKQNSIKKGFTIIEVVLFLGISSLLAVGLMVGWTTSIDRQRYNDTVNTLKANIQQVFSEVENTQNGRSEKFSCSTSAGTVSTKPDSSINGKDRGTTNCVSLGKMIIFNACDPSQGACIQPSYSDDYSVRDVIGKDIDIAKDCKNGSKCENDIDALRATKFMVSTAGTNRNGVSGGVLEWSGVYKAATDNRLSGGKRGFSGNISSTILTDTVYGVLILRSPIDGSVRTFGLPIRTDNDSLYTTTSQMSNFRDVIMSENTLVTKNKKIDICVAPAFRGTAGGAARVSGIGKNRAIRIGNSSASVELAMTDGAGSVTCSGETGFNGILRP